MKITSVFSLGLAACAAMSGAAHAQTAPVKPFSARLSIILPTSGAARSFIGSSTGQIGVSYAPPSLAKEKYAGRLDLDYGRFSKHGNRVEPVSLFVTGLVPVSKRGGFNNGVYLGAGLGAAYTRVRSGSVGFSDSKTNFVAKAFVGYSFTRSIFGEIGYTEFGKVSGIKPSNAFIQIGARF